MNPILVGLDGSKLAERGLYFATSLAAALKTTLVAARVVPGTWGTQGYDPDLQHRLEEADEKAASTYLAEMAERLRKEGTAVQTRLLHGRPSRALVAAAKQDECSMMVITSHGMSGLASRVFGSVAQRVLASAPCPVLVVPCADEDIDMEEELEELATDKALVGGMERMTQTAKR